MKALGLPFDLPAADAIFGALAFSATGVVMVAVGWLVLLF